MDIAPFSIDREQGKATLVVARSDFIDAFAELEEIVSRILRSAGHAPKGEPFCQRIKTFRGLDKTPLIAKQNFGARNQLADAILALLPVRADIVHSRLDVRTIDGVAAAMLTNAHESGTEYPTCRVLTATQFHELTARIVRYTQRIAALGKTKPETPSAPVSSPETVDNGEPD